MSDPNRSTFGKYVLLRKLASGGMGEIFLAKQRGPSGFEKLLVIKRILSHHLDKKDYLDMFFSEAKLVARLNHHNIIQIHEMGEIDGDYYIAMEYVRGKSLRDIIDELRAEGRQLPLAHSIDLAIKLCEGLGYAHQARDIRGHPMNIVHRDINPHNILISYTGDLKLIDFGIAKSEMTSVHTATGTIKGKFVYMSPEQSAADPIDRRSDIFSLGIVLYEMICLENPFVRQNVVLSLEAIQRQEVPLPSSKRSDAGVLNDILQRALHKRPEERYQTAIEMRDDLRNLIRQGRVRAAGEDMNSFLHRLFAADIDEEDRLLAEADQATATPGLADVADPDLISHPNAAVSGTPFGDEEPTLAGDPEGFRLRSVEMSQASQVASAPDPNNPSGTNSQSSGAYGVTPAPEPSGQVMMLIPPEEVVPGTHEHLRTGEEAMANAGAGAVRKLTGLQAALAPHDGAPSAPELPFDNPKPTMRLHGVGGGVEGASSSAAIRSTVPRGGIGGPPNAGDQVETLVPPDPRQAQEHQPAAFSEPLAGHTPGALAPAAGAGIEPTRELLNRNGADPYSNGRAGPVESITDELGRGAAPRSAPQYHTDEDSGSFNKPKRAQSRGAVRVGIYLMVLVVTTFAGFMVTKAVIGNSPDPVHKPIPPIEKPIAAPPRIEPPMPSSPYNTAGTLAEPPKSVEPGEKVEEKPPEVVKKTPSGTKAKRRKKRGKKRRKGRTKRTAATKGTEPAAKRVKLGVLTVRSSPKVNVSFKGKKRGSRISLYKESGKVLLRSAEWDAIRLQYKLDGSQIKLTIESTPWAILKLNKISKGRTPQTITLSNRIKVELMRPKTEPLALTLFWKPTEP